MTQNLDAEKHAILEAALKIAPFEGWNAATLRKAAQVAGFPNGADALYFPDGVLELIGFWSAHLDTQSRTGIEALDLANMKIREQITAAVLMRLEIITPHEDAARRAALRLIVPDAAAQGATQIWASADMIWRAIGDKSTDGNFYSKRATLAAIITATLPIWLADESSGKLKGREFLEARIANVMQFESFKWRMKSRRQAWPNPAEILGDLRYGKFPIKRRRRRHSRTL